MSEPQRALATINQAIVARQDRIGEIVPSHVDVPRFVRVAQYAVISNPELLQCSPQSIVESVMKAAQLGLEPTGEYGGGHLVKYGSTCQFVPDYRGILDVVRRSGDVSAVATRVVFENDDFDLDYAAADPLVKHKPAFTQRGKAIGYYARAYMKDGAIYFEWMSVEDVREHQSKLKSKNSPAWRLHFDRMAQKTALLRMMNLMPKSVERMMLSHDPGEGYTAPPPVSVTEAQATVVDIESRRPATVDVLDTETESPEVGADPHTDWPVPNCPKCETGMTKRARGKDAHFMCKAPGCDARYNRPNDDVLDGIIAGIGLLKGEWLERLTMDAKESGLPESHRAWNESDAALMGELLNATVKDAAAERSTDEPF